MNYARIPSLLILLNLFYSCTSKNSIDSKVISSTIVTTEMVDLRFSDYFDTLIVVPLETNENTLIGEISKIHTTDKYIFILDNRIAESLFLFDQKGKTVHSFIGTGEGPGEFIRASNFYPAENGQSVFIQDNSLSKILEFDLAGNFIREKKLSGDLWFYDLLPFEGGFYSAKPNLDDLGVFIDILNNKFESTGNPIYLLEDDHKIEGSMKDQFFYKGMEGEIYTKETLKNYVYQLEGIRIGKSFQFTFDENKWISTTPESKMKSREAYRQIWENDYFALGDQFLDTEKSIFINFWHGKTLKMLMVDKTTGESRIVGSFVNDLDGYIEKIPALFPSNSNPGQLIIDLHPSDFHNIISSKNGLGKYSESIDEIKGEIDDNPILFIYKKNPKD